MSRLRVLYAPRDIAGQPGEWAQAVRALGIDAAVWSFGEPAFGLRVDRVWDRDRLLADPDHRWAALDEAVRGFDVLHLQYGRSLVIAREPGLPELWDLPLLRSLGKRVLMHWHGSDVRLPSAHRRREPDSYLAGAAVDEEAILARLAIARRYCDRMLVSTPGLLDDVPDATLIPLCVDVEAWRAHRPAGEPPVPTVVHAPSRRHTKGSDAIDAALRPLAARGVIVYRPLRAIPRAAMPAELARADLVVDSLGIGDHGLIAVEAMAAGAVALAHVHPRNRRRTPGCPVVEVTAATLAGVVERLAADPGERARLRREGLDYVRARHDRSVVGRRLAAVYRAPATGLVAGHPDWPRSPGAARLAALETEIDRLRRLAGPAAAAPRPALRERLEAHPALHLAARRLAARLGRWAPVRTGSRRPPSLVLGPANMAGQGWAWAKAVERRWPTVRTEVITLERDSPLVFPTDRRVGPEQWRSRAWHRELRGHLAATHTHALFEGGLALTGAASGGWFDGDVAALSAAGLRLGVVLHGSEVRDPRRHRALHPHSPFADPASELSLALQRRCDRLAALLERHPLPCFVSTLDLLEFAPRARWLPVAVDTGVWRPGPEPMRRVRPLVLHAPSRPELKGTATVDAVASDLDRAGLIEYRRVEGVAVDALPALVSGADILLDQFAVGGYGVLAVEAMAAGRVVVGDVTAAVRARLGGTLPIVQATCASLREVIAGLVEDRDGARAAAAPGPEFVRRHHDGTASARVLGGFLGVEAAG